MDEEVKIALCISCIEEYGIPPQSILPGLSLWNSQKKFKAVFKK
jgi:hypothetical protein